LRLIAPLLALAACSSDNPGAPLTPSGIAAEQPATALGPHGVGYLQTTVTDSDRNREIPLYVWFPAEIGTDSELAAYPLSGPFTLPSAVAYADVSPLPDAQPLLVFSHGYNGIATQSVELMEWLASHGFIVISPEHVGNSQFAPAENFDDAARLRVPDVSFLLDTMLDEGAPGGVAVDSTAIGVLGHSFGGMTALGAAGGWADAPGDPRVHAIMPISAVIDGELQQDDRPSPFAGFSDETLGQVTVPTLLLGGTEDINVPIENNQLAFDALNAAPVSYNAEIIGANHNHFASICAIGDRLLELGIEQSAWAALGADELIAIYDETCSETAFPIATVTELTQILATSFFRSVLLGESEYELWLTPEYANARSALTMESRNSDQ